MALPEQQLPKQAAPISSPVDRGRDGDYLAQIFAAEDGPAYFLDNIYGKTFHLFHGTSNRFSHLVSTKLLLQWMEADQSASESVIVVQNDINIAPEMYCVDGKIIVPLLQRFLNKGAGVLCTEMHHKVPALAALSKQWTALFKVGVNINIFFGGTHTKKFTNHIDHHDVFAMQVYGRKRWYIYPPTRPDPLLLPQHATAPPTGKPLWEGVLEQGDVLYVPRGWWHRAEGMDDIGTLHLACGIQPTTGIHLLRWWSDELLKNDLFRKELPRFVTPTEQNAYLQKLLKELTNEAGDTLIERFLTSRENKS